MVRLFMTLLVLGLWLGARGAFAWQEPAVADIYRLPPVDDEAEALMVDEALVVDEQPLLAPPSRRRTLAGSDRAPLKASAFWSPSADLRTQPGELSLLGEGLDFGVALFMMEGQVWLLTGGVHHLQIGGDARLPDSGVALPDELWKAQLGAFHSRTLDNGWQAGGIFSVGSASDEPFASVREMTATMVGFLNVPAANDRDAWNYSLFYSTASQLPFPIPGVAYAWNPSEQWKVKIGVPFSLEYCPTETLALSATYMPLTNVRLMARQVLSGGWEVYAGYEVASDTYLLAGRVDHDERLYFFDQRVRAGVERALLAGFHLDLSVGYQFDREIFQSPSFSGERRDVIGIEPGALAGLAIVWRR